MHRKHLTSCHNITCPANAINGRHRVESGREGLIYKTTHLSHALPWQPPKESSSVAMATHGNLLLYIQTVQHSHDIMSLLCLLINGYISVYTPTLGPAATWDMEWVANMLAYIYSASCVKMAIAQDWTHSKFFTTVIATLCTLCKW